MSPCILQIEDDEGDVLLLQHAFRAAEIHEVVQVAADGQEAIDYLSGTGHFSDRTKYPLPNLVLLDLKLPDKSGLQVLEWMRAQPALRTTVVVALTSSSLRADVQRAYELGANSYVVKPSGIQKLTELARSLRSWWLGYNQFAPS
jgi:CheY-like chemotaxis protein